MKINQRTCTVLEFTTDEERAFEKVYNIISKIQHTYVDDAHLVNAVTGEVVSIDELPRILGILSALSTTCIWDVQ